MDLVVSRADKFRASLPMVLLLPEPKRRIRWLSREEADRLLAELPAHLADMMQFSLATGLRESNVTGLRWNQVDLGRGVVWIHADEAKAGSAIGVPLNRDALLVLKKMDRQAPGECLHLQSETSRQGGRGGLEEGHRQGGTPLHVLQELGGWSSAEMVRRYAHLAPGHLADHARAAEDRIRTVQGERQEVLRTVDGTPEKKKARSKRLSH